MTHRVQPRHAAPTVSLRTKVLAGRRQRLLATAAAGLSVLSLLGASHAAGATTAGHNPYGVLDAAIGGPGGTIAVSGWAVDPDAPTTSLTVVFTIDGARTAQQLANVSRPDVARVTGSGVLVGFSGTLLTTPGPHTVCALIRNVGPGASGAAGCTRSTVPAPSDADLVHYPTGRLDAAAVSGNTVTVTGWAVDPDAASTPLRIMASVDGNAVAPAGLAAVARPDVAAVVHSGPMQGYRFTLTLTNGQHQVCTGAANVGPGAPNNLGCATVQIGQPAPTPAQVAAHSPTGKLEAAAAVNAHMLSVRGWASDPDNRGYPLVVVGYTDGVAHTPMRASLPRPDLAGNPAAGANSGFAFNLSVGSSAHIVCLWAVNIGIGTNVALGCLPVATPAVSMATGPRPPTPAVGPQIVAAAKKFLGGKYVWGGEDPKVGFDCSGLVQYTYRGLGLSTPRVAQDQFAAAHMITAGRAVPGDLVFYHDSYGNVYHVGIYVSPGVTYAAVDQQEGIRVQSIWDSTATYGSFTHS
ncbi:MAG TPA: NlpC/P60 family protein [Jatrophihabitans sp.]|nr:NlpC/P60 family protein [Jatrophihabitans sp.]